MTQKPRLNLTVSQEVYENFKKRKNFNISKFLELRYREEFMNKKSLKSNLEELDKKRGLLAEKLKGEAKKLEKILGFIKKKN